MAITTKMIKDAWNAPPRPQIELDAEYARHLAEQRAQREADAGKEPHWEGSDFVFSSGRRVHAYRQMFGLSMHGAEGGFEVGYGADGDVWPAHDWMTDDPDGTLTAADMREVADMMIARWQAFKDTLK